MNTSPPLRIVVHASSPLGRYPESTAYSVSLIRHNIGTPRYHLQIETLTQNLARKKKSSFLIYRTVQLIFFIHLTLEGERGADLVASLVELGGVEGKAEAEGGAGVELGAVGKGGDTAVVDLDL